MQVHRPAAARHSHFPGFTLRPFAWLCGWLLPVWPARPAPMMALQHGKPRTRPAGCRPACGFGIGEAVSTQLPTEKQETYTIKHSTSATRLNLSPRETPQAGRW
jgi:outer membrane receptor for ferric coprogen and ferric-rhodotorulic acid